jgi:hypothetical protein
MNCSLICVNVAVLFQVLGVGTAASYPPFPPLVVIYLEERGLWEKKCMKVGAQMTHACLL